MHQILAHLFVFTRTRWEESEGALKAEFAISIQPLSLAYAPRSRKLLVPFSDSVILAAEHEQALCKQRLCVAFQDTRPENVARGFDISVAMVDPDDKLVFELLHKIILSARLSGLSIWFYFTLRTSF